MGYRSLLKGVLQFENDELGGQDARELLHDPTPALRAEELTCLVEVSHTRPTDHSIVKAYGVHKPVLAR